MKYNELTSKVKEYQDRIKELEVENEDFRKKVQDSIRNFTGTFRVKSGNIKSGNFIEGESGWSLGPESAELRDVTVAGTLSAVSGTLGDLEIASGGYIRQGQTGYDDGTGFWLGDDSGTTKYSLGNSTGNKLTWDGSDLTIRGTVQTAASGQRAVLQDSDNTFRFYSSNGQVLGMGTEVSSVIEINCDSTAANGVRIDSSVAGNGITYINSGDVNNKALAIYMPSADDACDNDNPAIYVKYGGNNYVLNSNVYGHNAGGIYLGRYVGTGAKSLVHLYESTTNDTPMLKIQKNYSGNLSGPLVDIQQYSYGIALQVDHGNASADCPSLKIFNNATSVSSPALLIDKDNYGVAMEIDQDTGTADNAIGLKMNISNSANTTKAYAFSFQGNETLGSAVGGDQDQKIRIWIGGTEYYIPCYTE